jgi:chlorobactene glucosyltransferase
LIFLGVLVAISLTNLRALRRPGSYPRLKAFPHVSVLIPARNEEENIVACVLSLLKQDYPNFEVIVLDDHSEDQTHPLVQRIAVGNPPCVLRGKPIPPGWLGKNWACHQLAQASTGEILLFTDADTVHRPSMLHDAVAALFAERVDFLSALPHQELAGWGDRLILPILPWSLQSFLPLTLARRTRWQGLSIAIGQFLVFRRSAYDAVGGHQAVRHCIAEDRALIRQIKQQGVRWTFLDGRQVFTSRAYRGIKEVWNGLSKSLFATFGYNLPLCLFVWSWLVWVAWEPPLVLILQGSGVVNMPSGLALPAVIAVGLSLLLWGISTLRFRLPAIQLFLYPITILLMLLIALRSIGWHYLHRGTWKGRPLDLSQDP